MHWLRILLIWLAILVAIELLARVARFFIEVFYRPRDEDADVPEEEVHQWTEDEL